MAIDFQSKGEALRKLRERLRSMSDEELIKFGKEVRRLSENPFQRQLEEARAEWRRRKGLGNGSTPYRRSVPARPRTALASIMPVQRQQR